jgi:hypothetical protein
MVVGALAQTQTSRLEGSVTDQTGAVVPGAKITAVNVKTDVTAETTTSAAGLYVFPSLQPGLYTVSVEAQGFRKAVRTSLELNVSVTVAENFKMEVGNVTESVVVEANVERVNTSESQLGRSVTIRDITSLPQLGRQPINLAVFQPGVQIDPGDNSYSRVNGTRSGSNNSSLDGIDVNDAVVPRMGLSMTANNTDSVAEVRIVTGGGKAEYGRSAGAQVELISRSGSNMFHGSAFDYLRNTDLNANNFFNNTNRIARPTFIQNMFGGTFGGPIKHDKLFVFGNYQGRRTTQQVVQLRTVLTPQAKSGIFRWKDPSSQAVQSFNIVANDPRKIGIDSQVAALLKLLPDPNNTDVGEIYNTAGFRFNQPAGSLEDQFTIRGDYNLTNNHRLFYRHSWQRNSSIDTLNSADTPFPGGVQGSQGGHRWGFAVGSDWTITPSLVNSARYGHQSATADFVRPQRLKGAQILPNSYTNPILPNFAQGRNSPVNEWTDNASFIKGKHTLKAGTNIRFTTQWGYNDAGIYPNVSLTRTQGNTPPATIGPVSPAISSTDRTTFENLYNDLLGRISTVTQTYYSDLQQFQAAGVSRIRTFKFHEYGYFFQDDWKAKKNLTLNLGIRWEFSGVPYEANTLQGTLDKSALINAVNQFADLKVQRSTQWYNNDYNNFAPRIGFAWDPKGDGKMALRGGVGIYYDRLIGATTSAVDGATPGFSQAVPVYPNSGGTDVRAGDGIPKTPQPAAPSLQLPATRSTSIALFGPDLRTGYTEQWSLIFEREIYRNTIVNAGYVGTRGVKLFMNVNYNQPKIYGDFLTGFQQIQAYRTSGAAVPASNVFVRLFGSPAAAVTAVSASTFDQGLVGTAAATIDTTSSNYSRYAAAGLSDFYLRNYPQYIDLRVGTNNGRAYYDSLQVQLRRQTGALKFYANYTFSKSIDNTSVDGNGYTAPWDSYNLKLNRARGDYDRPHVLNYQIIYTLPIGKAHRLGGSLPRWADSLLGGWDIGMLGIWESGSVFNVGTGRATTAGGQNSFADYNGDRNIGSVQRLGNGVFYLTDAEKAQFTYPVAGSIGTSGRNAFRNPRFFNTDLSLVKRFKISERHVVHFRVEAYNLLNNPNFGGLGTSIATPASFGKLSSTINAARIFQMALRYEF